LRIIFTSRDVLRQELQQADSVLLEEAAKIGARRIFIDGVARLVGGNEKGRQTFLRLWSSVVEHLFATGYAPGSLPAPFDQFPVLQKPFQQRDLQRVIGATLGD
jgi:hypothetical protein